MRKKTMKWREFMKRLIKAVLIILSYVPVTTVAMAAQAKVSEIEGENQNAILRKKLQIARSRVFKAGSTSATFEEIFKVHSEQTRFSGPEFKQSLEEDLQFLQDNGYIQFNETGVISSSPSQYAM